MDLLDPLLTEHTPVRKTLPAIRLNEELKKGDEALWPTAIKTPAGDTFFYFSRPYLVIKPERFVSLSTSNMPPEIDERFFIQNPGYKVAVVPGRCNGSLINQMLKEIREENTTSFASFHEEFPRLKKLLDHGRITGFFAYEDEVKILCSEFDIPISNFRFSKVTGVDSILFSIAAPKTPWGSAMIERVNGVIDTIKKPVAQKYMESLPPVSRADYLTYSREILGY